MVKVLQISVDFEASKDAVIAAMLFPRSEAFQTGYRLRRAWKRRLHDGDHFTVTTAEIQALLDAPGRAELREAAKDGVKFGVLAGDLLLLIFERWRNGKPEPSLRSALRSYPEWTLGKKYGDKSPLPYSTASLRKALIEAEPAAHLWAAFRVLMSREGRARPDRLAFTRAELPHLLGIARAVQDFATTFIPKRTKQAKPVIDPATLLQVPIDVEPIQIDVRLL